MRWFGILKEERLLKGVVWATLTAPLLAATGILGIIGIAALFAPRLPMPEMGDLRLAAQVIGSVMLFAFLITTPSGLLIGLPVHFALRRVGRQPMWLYALLAGLGSAVLGIAMNSGAAMVLGYFLGSISAYVFWRIVVRPMRKDPALPRPEAS